MLGAHSCSIGVTIFVGLWMKELFFLNTLEVRSLKTHQYNVEDFAHNTDQMLNTISFTVSCTGANFGD